MSSQRLLAHRPRDCIHTSSINRRLRSAPRSWAPPPAWAANSRMTSPRGDVAWCYSPATPMPSPRVMPSAFASKARQRPLFERACTLENIR